MKLKERFTIEQALSMNTKELYLFVVEIYEKLKDDEYVMDRYCEQLDRRWWFQPKPTLPILKALLIRVLFMVLVALD
jgi:hypothetical protein